MPEEEEAGNRMASRIEAIMENVDRYMIDGRRRLMEDTGLSRTEVHRLVTGDCNPSYRVVLAVVEALERQVGERIDPREILSYGGAFERTVCAITRCRGCPVCKPYQAPPALRTGDATPLPVPANQPNTNDRT